VTVLSYCSKTEGVAPERRPAAFNGWQSSSCIRKPFPASPAATAAAAEDDPEAIGVAAFTGIRIPWMSRCLCGDLHK
jgi:hypothetical protein